MYECLILSDTMPLVEAKEKKDEQLYGAVVKKNKERISEMIVAYFFASIVWSIGGGLIQDSKEKFSNFFNKICRNGCQGLPVY